MSRTDLESWLSQTELHKIQSKVNFLSNNIEDELQFAQNYVLKSAQNEKDCNFTEVKPRQKSEENNKNDEKK